MRAICKLLPTLGATLLLSGCATTEYQSPPLPTSRTYDFPYDRVWGAIVATVSPLTYSQTSPLPAEAGYGSPSLPGAGLPIRDRICAAGYLARNISHSERISLKAPFILPVFSPARRLAGGRLSTASPSTKRLGTSNGLFTELEGDHVTTLSRGT